MKRSLWIGLATVVLAAAGGGGLLLIHGEDAGAGTPAREFAPTQRAAIDQMKAMSDGYVALSEAVVPSVVTITSERVIEPTQGPSPFDDPFFRRFFDMPRQGPQRQRGLGSGVIVQEDGHILTNNHVIREASELTVILSDGRELEATVVGADPRSDLAVLKVDATGLPAMPFGDSDQVRIGQWVLAVGSPFSRDLSATITSGIVSGTGRSGMRLNDYEDFIQTDAAVNPGNSGGALVDLDGNLIGINTAIASRAGGYDGISFAIPSNMAMDVMTDLIADGKVTRGWLGVGIQTLSQDLAEAMNLENQHGVLVTSVQAEGPAAKAGVETEDVIVAIDGNPVKDSEHLRLVVARIDPGTAASLDVLRQGKEKHLRIEIGLYPDEEPGIASVEGKDLSSDLGIEVSAITPDVARQLDLEQATGLVVTQVEPGSPAEAAGIQPGDLVRKVNQESVVSLGEYREAVKGTPEGKPVLLQVQRRDNNFFVALKPDK